MSLPLAEHDAAGRVRYLIATQGAPTVEAYRPVDTLPEAIPSIEPGQWLSGPFACLACSFGWVAVAPVSVNERKLECLRCGAHESAPVRAAWCSACGHEFRVAQSQGAPAEGGECPSCHAMAALVEAA